MYLMILFGCLQMDVSMYQTAHQKLWGDRSELLVLLRKARTAGPWDSGSFAMRRQDKVFSWVELVDGRQAYSHFGDAWKMLDTH